MFESTAAALAFVFGLIAVGLTFLFEFNLFRLVGTIVLTLFLVYQISCLDLGDCDVLSYTHALIPFVLSAYFVYLYYTQKKDDKKKKKKEKTKRDKKVKEIKERKFNFF